MSCVSPRGVWKVGVIENKKLDQGDFRRISRRVGHLLEAGAFLDPVEGDPYNRVGGEGASHEVRRHP